MVQAMRLIIYTDGASRGNPGRASYGFTISDKKKNLIYEEGKYIGVATNNVAEYSGVLEALRYIKENLQKATEINFYMDSKLVAQQLSGKWKIKSRNLKPLIEQIKNLKKSLVKITYKHVPRIQNQIADRLANRALDLL